jgi:hypothetical protein
MSRKPQSVRGKYDETYQELRRRALDDDYEGFWNVIHDYEHKRFKETAKVVVVAMLFGLFMYGCYYIFLK